MTLPYAGIVEPITSYYAADASGTQRLRNEYYGDLDTYIYRPDIKKAYQVSPEIDTRTCFVGEFEGAVSPLLPDMTGAVKGESPVVVHGEECTAWTLQSTTAGRVSSYTLYVNANTGVPVQYHMLGYNTLTGSHFDEYVVDYLEYTPGGANATVFDAPDMTCGGYPGPGASVRRLHDPTALHARMFPSRSGAEYGHVEAAGLDGVSAQFAAWMHDEGRRYASEAELRARHAIWTDTAKMVSEANAKAAAEGRSMRLSLNHMADMEREERMALMGLVEGRTVEQDTTGDFSVHAAPESGTRDLPDFVDWRQKGAVTDVKDQGTCGSCWSFGTTGTLEGSLFIKTGQLIRLSQQELMDCSWNFGNNACGGGEAWRAYKWIMQRGGLSSAASYGNYLMQDGYCKANTSDVAVSLKGYTSVQSGSESALMDAIARNGPVAIAIDAAVDTFLFYSEGVYSDVACKNGVDDLDHAVLAVGYGTDAETGEDYWIVKNSWSTHWGDDGYIRIARQGNICGVATSPTYATLA
jgi:C1A family cysteine protease